MNRRQFIGRITSALGGIAVFGRPVLRGGTVDGIAAGTESAQPEMDEMHTKANCSICRRTPFILYSYRGWLICGWHSCRIGVDECESYRVATGVGIDDGGACYRKMEQFLAANPEMTREQAFFQAVMEIAESTL